MSSFLDLLSWLCLVGGAVVVVISGLGVVRLPDFFARVHGAAITETLGAALILVGLSFQAGLSLVTVKLILVLAFLVITGPVSAHALAKAAFLFGQRPRVVESGRDDRSGPSGQ